MQMTVVQVLPEAAAAGKGMPLQVPLTQRGLQQADTHRAYILSPDMPKM